MSFLTSPPPLVIQHTPSLLFLHQISVWLCFPNLWFCVKSFPRFLGLWISLIPLPSFPLSLTHAYGELTNLDVPLGSLVTVLCVCVFHGTENLSGSKPHRVLSEAGLWCDSSSGTALALGCRFGSRGAALPGFRACSSGHGGHSAQILELSIFPFIPGLMVEWQGVPMLFQARPVGLVQRSLSLAAPVNSSGAFPGAEVWDQFKEVM